MFKMMDHVLFAVVAWKSDRLVVMNVSQVVVMGIILRVPFVNDEKRAILLLGNQIHAPHVAQGPSQDGQRIHTKTSAPCVMKGHIQVKKEVTAALHAYRVFSSHLVVNRNVYHVQKAGTVTM